MSPMDTHRLIYTFLEPVLIQVPFSTLTLQLQRPQGVSPPPQESCPQAAPLLHPQGLLCTGVSPQQLHPPVSQQHDAAGQTHPHFRWKRPHPEPGHRGPPGQHMLLGNLPDQHQPMGHAGVQMLLELFPAAAETTAV